MKPPTVFASHAIGCSSGVIGILVISALASRAYPQSEQWIQTFETSTASAVRGAAHLRKYDPTGKQLWTRGFGLPGYIDLVASGRHRVAPRGSVSAKPRHAANSAAPVVTSVSNAASSIPEGVPGDGIARGSLFVIKGTDLGPSDFVIATTFPLRHEVGGTSVTVTVEGQTAACIMYYAGATQVAAILPSSSPVGRGTMMVTYNGVTAAAFPFTVVRSAIGVYTLNTSGGGDAVATLGAGFVGPVNAANPGDIVAFWATGLGPVSFDETNPAQQFDMTDVEVKAWIAGRSADVVFRGRSACCSSVDAIYVRIPEGVDGCVTPVVFRIGDSISNTTSIPTAASGRTCRPTIPNVTTTDVEQILSKPVVSSAGVGLYRTSSAIGAELGPLPDGGTAGFVRNSLLPGGLGFTNWDVPQGGSCMVYSGASFSGSTLALQWLDAGAAVGVSGRGGPRAILKTQTPLVLNYNGVFDFGGSYINPGRFTIIGAGGADIGGFSAAIDYPGTILRWTNQDRINNINRGESLTIEWTGGDLNGYVQILGFSTAAASKAAAASFVCTARTADGTFTVPAYVTLAMAPSDPTFPAAVWPSSLWVASQAAPVRFQAPGLDFGLVALWSLDAKTVTYRGSAGIAGTQP